jgi:hypothetical protein
MKKKTKKALLLALFLLTVYYLVTLLPIAPTDRADLKVLLIYNPNLSKEFGYVLKAWRSVLEEEGVPYKAAAPSYILSEEPSDMVRTYPALILPDKIARSLPSDMKFWVKEYLEQGGDVAVVFDAGSQNLKFQYLNRGLFSNLLGLNYVIYNEIPDSNDATTTAYIKFKNQESVWFFQVAPGKTDENFFLNGYQYGRLIFPIARVRTEEKYDEQDVHAYGITEKGERYPVLMTRKVFIGNLLYANLPLGHLKAHSDDLLLRSTIRTLLFKVAGIPHLVNTPQGKAGLVINWHIDWSEDWAGLEYMKKNGFFTPNVKHSIHNTAGNFTDRPGDGLGFDACGQGRETLKSVLKYGRLGSHGGWAHNWFYKNILNGTFGEKEIEMYIVKNNNCLSTISGYPVTEYSAPNGVHPQPLATRILERNGVEAYYYTGDSGSAPNRTFFDKKMVSKNVIAFPVLSYKAVASFFEMDRDGYTAAHLKDWLHGLLDYLLENRTVRLIYSHSYDVPPYFPGALLKFIQRVEQTCKEGKMLARPMTYFARFTRRFLKTKMRFRHKTDNMVVRVINPEGLKDITIAIPKRRYRVPDDLKGVVTDEDDMYYYLTVTENPGEKTIYIPYRTD